MSVELSKLYIKKAYNVKFIHYYTSGDLWFFVLENSNVKYKLYKSKPIKNLTKKRRIIGNNATMSLTDLISKYQNKITNDVRLNEKRNCIELWYKMKNKSNYTIFEIHKKDASSELINELDQRFYKDFFD